MFHDRSYNRARYDLVSYVLHDCTGNPIYSPLHQTVIAMAEATFNAINLEFHEGAHPRLGALDDIIFHPLGHASLDEAAWLAKAVAADIGNRFSGKYIKLHDQRMLLTCLSFFSPYLNSNVMQCKRNSFIFM